MAPASERGRNRVVSRRRRRSEEEEVTRGSRLVAHQHGFTRRPATSTPAARTTTVVPPSGLGQMSNLRRRRPRALCLVLGRLHGVKQTRVLGEARDDCRPSAQRCPAAGLQSGAGPLRAYAARRSALRRLSARGEDLRMRKRCCSLHPGKAAHRDSLPAAVGGRLPGACAVPASRLSADGAAQAWQHQKRAGFFKTYPKACWPCLAQAHGTHYGCAQELTEPKSEDEAGKVSWTAAPVSGSTDNLKCVPTPPCKEKPA